MGMAADSRTAAKPHLVPPSPEVIAGPTEVMEDDGNRRHRR
jgi:hypothetical protein